MHCQIHVLVTYGQKCVLIDNKLRKWKTDNAGVAVEIFVKKKRRRVLGIHEQGFDMK